MGDVIRLPGLIDCHVHLRDPGATHKEDFSTGTQAAVAGGITFVMDMPNNSPPTTSIARLEEKVARANATAVCDVGFHYGTDGRNLGTFVEAAAHPRVFGLKIYLNHTTGELLVEDIEVLAGIFEAWPGPKPILVHAEGVQLAAAIALAQLYGQRLHVCHISQAVEVDLVRRAKGAGQDITAGACPHHLYLTETGVVRLGARAIMKPPLGSSIDRDALWAGLTDRTIDVIETDHAPHTLEEKADDPPPFGVPGLETALPLMLLAVHEGRLSLEDIVRLMHDSPRLIFGVPEQPDTYVELDPGKTYRIGSLGFKTKCGWSPFEDVQAYGPVERTVVRGQIIG
jgi:dihydroorotase-like cyclic amidohydrolase